MSKLIEELIINVKQKGLTSVVNNAKKLQDNLLNAAAGAEILDSSLKPIPESLKAIIAEARQADDIIGSLGMGKGFDRLEEALHEIEESMLELIGASTKMNDTLTHGFNNMSNKGSHDLHELIVQLEKLEDTTENAARRQLLQTKIQNGLAESSEKVNRGLGRQNAQGRGAARNFANIAKFAGPLPGLYAIIAANVFAVSEAFRMLSEGAQLNRLEQIGIIMGQSIGTPIQSVARGLQEATGFAVSYEDALRQASSASTFGFTAKQINDMTLAARRASVALGVDMNDALNRIIRGVSKLEIELLDELGITVRLNEAYSKYAEKLGVAETALTSYQKQQAYLNAVLAESEKRQSSVDPYLQANGWELLGASVKSATLELTKFFASSLGPGAKELSSFINLFNTSNLEKDVTDYTSVLSETLKGKGSQGVANAYLAINAAQNAGLDTFGVNLESRIRLQTTKQFDGMVDMYSKINPMMASMMDSLFRSAVQGSDHVKEQVKEGELLWERYNNTLVKVQDSVGGVTVKQAELAAEAIQNAKAQKSTVELFDTIASKARGTSLPFEQLGDGITSLNSSLTLLETHTNGIDLYELLSIPTDTISGAVDLMGALRNEFLATTLLAENKIRIQENGLKSGKMNNEVVLETLRLERGLLEASLHRASVAEASPAQKLGIQTAINKSKLEELAIVRDLARERLSEQDAMRGLLRSTEIFNDGYDQKLTNYQAAITLSKDSIAIMQQELDTLDNTRATSAERLTIETKINEAKKARADLDAQEAIRALEMNMSAMNSVDSQAGGVGPIASLDKEAETRAKVANDLFKQKLINQDTYIAMMLRANEVERAGIQATLEQQAAVENLFMARTGMQSTIAMNLEQELAYQQQIGASIYETSRSALDSFNPAMGAMFDGLQSFTYALEQVGKTSEGTWNAVASGIQAAASIMAFASDKAVQGLDKEIAAEKKRDGKSAESKKKLAQLEAKKQKEELKAKRTSIIANTAAGIMSALGTSGNIYAGLALSAIVAGMGAMQLSALDSGSIADPSGAGNIGKLELGSRENVVNLDKGASEGELNFIRGNKGVGGIQDFVPRARGNNLSPNVAYATGEHGMEVVSSNGSGSSVTSSEDTFNGSTGKKGIGMSLTINALDSQSVIDRAAEIFAAVEAEANVRGYTLER